MKFRIWQRASGQYFWQMIDNNGRELARSSKGYASRSNAKRAIQTIQNWAHRADIE